MHCLAPLKLPIQNMYPNIRTYVIQYVRQILTLSSNVGSSLLPWVHGLPNHLARSTQSSSCDLCIHTFACLMPAPYLHTLPFRTSTPSSWWALRTLMEGCVVTLHVSSSLTTLNRIVTSMMTGTSCWLSAMKEVCMCTCDVWLSASLYLAMY